MYKKVNVVMLPTNEKAIPRDLVLSINNNLRLLDVDKTGNFTKQHLYILSDEEIKEGDWFYHEISHIVSDNYNLFVKQSEQGHIMVCKKIIATTDKSIDIIIPKGADYEKRFYFPQPSQSFIEKYVEEYNKGNIITEVMVEYEECKPGMCKINNMTCGHSGCSKPFLKINPKDNTITIRKMKDSWTKKEQFENIIKFRDDYEKFKNDCHFGPNNKEIEEWTDKWIEENL